MIGPRDVLAYVGGKAMEQFGTPVWRASTVQRQGELQPTYTRPSVAAATQPNGRITKFEANQPRLGWLDPDADGVYEYPVLLFENIENQVQRSEEFDNVYWSTTNITPTANDTTAPDGTSTADKLDEGTANGTHVIWRQTLTGTSQDVWTGSVYLKAGTGDWVRLRIDTAVNSNTYFAEFWFDLSTGTLGTQQTGASGVIDNITVEDAGDGWYRLQLAMHASSGTSTDPRLLVYLADADTTETYTGTNRTYWAWGAQFEDEDWPRAHSYIPTTSAAVTVSDTFTLPYNLGIVPVSVYLRFIELGGIKGPSARQLFNIGGGNDPRIDIRRQTGGNYGAFFLAASGSSNSIELAAAPAAMQLVELVLTLDSAYEITIHQSIDGGAVSTAGPSSGALTGVPAAYDAATMSFGSNGAGNHIKAAGLHAGVVARGSAHTIADFRKLLRL